MICGKLKPLKGKRYYRRHLNFKQTQRYLIIGLVLLVLIHNNKPKKKTRIRILERYGSSPSQTDDRYV